MQRAVSVLALLSLACSDSTDPDHSSSIPGRYSATTFTTIIGPDTTDLVADGLRFRITFSHNSRMKGILQAPGADSFPFTGAWLEADSLIGLKMNPPTILEDLRFHHRANRLEVDTPLGKTRFQIVLSRH